MKRALGTATLLFTLHTTAAGALQTPEWFQVDHKAATVTMRIVASQDPSRIFWAFNGYHHGNATITVPEGYKVTINFSNEDYVMHSVGVVAPWAGEPPASPSGTPAFAGAISSNPTDVATPPDEAETITFTASKAGRHLLACLVPTHAVAGMWVTFNVAAGLEAGVQTGK